MNDFLEKMFVALIVIFGGLWMACLSIIILLLWSSPVWIVALVIWLAVR